MNLFELLFIVFLFLIIEHVFFLVSFIGKFVLIELKMIKASEVWFYCVSILCGLFFTEIFRLTLA